MASHSLSDPIRLSLERPYKNDAGKPLLSVADILPSGEYIYEPIQTPSAKLADNLRRIFRERGTDFFQKHPDDRPLPGTSKNLEDQIEDGDEDRDAKPMTTEELFKLRTEILPKLYEAMNEMMQARDVLSSQPNAPPFPSSLDPNAPPLLGPDVLMASAVERHEPPLPVQAIDSVVVVGHKDQSLRRAADILKTAAESIERTQAAGEKYWMEALELRRQNWSLFPAPTGRPNEKTARDFRIFFGLSETFAIDKRLALAALPYDQSNSEPVLFPQQEKIWLRISLVATDKSGASVTSSSTPPPPRSTVPDDLLRDAQRSFIEQEIFRMLIRDAGHLSYASCRVSDKVIVLEAAQGVELRCELVSTFSSATSLAGPDRIKCDLIYNLLFVLLIQTHTFYKQRRLAGLRPPDTQSMPRLLHPIVDLLQYTSFCTRIRGEMGAVVRALCDAGIPTKFSFRAVGDNCAGLFNDLVGTDKTARIGGDVTIRIDSSRSIRFVFHAPSTLIAHLPQATLQVSSVPQLTQLLRGEVEQCILGRICAVGGALTAEMNGTWFVDPLTMRAVGKWEGFLLNFHLTFDESGSIRCTVARLHRAGGHATTVANVFTPSDTSFFAWLREIIRSESS
ncbi:subunit 17 of mediator complex-domain-containing protein [Vararia minispora EC-137]|uniref:Subunit 17 of mediator complex-domain-containing protein n=1 Tax=Vararia minispora EC-137 TaxID=1314806 RepID=A0ACB8QY35_9AGAM|nr:subunit 17 of mediator complex-domain-containing protein [Vararia minispora EC-137]